MELQEPNTDILLIGNPLPFDKEFKDLRHSQELQEKTIIFKDGEDEYANIFLLKVGLNGNGWGVGQETFEQRADEFLLNPVLIDPDGKVHASNSNGTGKYPLAHILENQNPLVAGLITQVIKYDTNNDGKYDLARGIMKLDPKKRERFHEAIKAGINETSPTLLPLNINEPAQKLLTYKPVNVVFTKNGAYLEHSKVKALCKGSETSCSNALAASLEKNNVSLIQLLHSNGNMSSNDNTTSSNNVANPQQTVPNTGQPVFNIFGSNPQNDSKNTEQSKQTETQAKPQEPTAEQAELEKLRKENKILLQDTLTSLRNEIAPQDLFEKEDDYKAFHKELGDDLERIKWFKNVAKAYVPKMVALYEKTKAGQKQEGTDQKKDEKGNPLAASQFELPKFNNDAQSGNTTNPMENLIKKHSLKELFLMNQKIIRRTDE